MKLQAGVPGSLSLLAYLLEQFLLILFVSILLMVIEVRWELIDGEFDVAYVFRANGYLNGVLRIGYFGPADIDFGALDIPVQVFEIAFHGLLGHLFLASSSHDRRSCPCLSRSLNLAEASFR